MNTRTPLATALAALALATNACTITTTPSSSTAATEKPKADATTAKADTPAAADKVPDAPKTPAAPASEKPAKAEAVPASLRSLPPAPDSWTVVQDSDFGIQFRVPSQWNAGVRNDASGNVFVAAPQDESMVLCVVNFENPDIGDEEVLATLLDELGFRPEGEYERVDDGLIVAHGTGDDGGQSVYFVAMVYAYEDVNYVTYIVTPQAQASQNRSTMRQILESFELI
jgi:hypothetical protein